MNNACRNYIKEFNFLFMGQRSGFGPSWREPSGNNSETGEAGTVMKGFLCNHEKSHISGSRDTKKKIPEKVHGGLMWTLLNISLIKHLFSFLYLCIRTNF